ncbi:MAG TPA: glycosyltransferase family 9 protein [Gemmatimonadaceae bacterium]
MTPPAAAWAVVRRVLCVRLDTLGDVLMTTPALRAVREHGGARGCEVTLLTSAPGAAVAALVPVIDDAIVYEAPWLKASPEHGDASRDAAMIDLLRSRRFDAAIIFTVFTQSALPAAFLCYLADIPLRLAHARENPYHLLSTWVPEPEPAQGIRHEVERQLALVEQVGCRTTDTMLSLRVPSDARCTVRRLLASLGLDGERDWLVMHPGATAPSRRYPAEQFGEVVRILANETRTTVLVTGDESEGPLTEQVCASSGGRAHSLAGRLTLGELAALVEAAPVLVTNNTGPAHLAAAVGTPVVDLYALTNPQHTPWRVPSRVLSFDVPCRNCFKSVCPAGHNDCLRKITPAEVAAAVRELLATTRPAAPKLSA